MRPKRKRPSSLVNRANEATAVKLAEALPAPLSSKGKQFEFQLKKASQLSAEERAQIWSIENTNMRGLLSNSSMGWHEQEKKKELFDPILSRLVIARHQERGKDREEDPQLCDADVIAGFCMFRFEYDQGERLLYCYELQVAEPWQRCGLGRSFVDCLVDLGQRWKMQKVMLTVLKANVIARDFYLVMGFSKDVSSPDYVPPGGNPDEADKCDYDIMSFLL